MNVVFTCGGTGGHINPAIAVANIWKERYPDTKFLFVGGGDDLEKELVPKAGYDLICVPAYGLRRSRDFQSLKRNAKALWLTVNGIAKCRKIFRYPLGCVGASLIDLYTAVTAEKSVYYKCVFVTRYVRALYGKLDIYTSAARATDGEDSLNVRVDIYHRFTLQLGAVKRGRTYKTYLLVGGENSFNVWVGNIP